MKKIVIASAILLLASCKKNETTTVKDGTVITTETATTDAATVQEQTKDELSKIDLEKLKTTTPATKEQLESVFPAEISGYPKVTENPGAISIAAKQSAAATYMKSEKPTDVISVIIVDAAGADAAKYQEQFEKYKNSEMAQNAQANLNLSSEMIGGNRVFFNEAEAAGVKAMSANFMAKGRYAIIVSGSSVTKEIAKDAISKLDFSKLPE